MTLMQMRRLALILGALIWGLAHSESVMADSTITFICPTSEALPRAAEFDSRGVILTSFDGAAIWAYDIDRDARYPLPNTAPCGGNCNLSRDYQWITYHDALTGGIGKMRLNGSYQTPLARNAMEVDWWSNDTLVIWTSNHELMLRPENVTAATFVAAPGLTSVQPGGYWATSMRRRGDTFEIVLLNLQDYESVLDPIVLTPFESYFRDSAWAPNGEMLAFVRPLEGPNNYMGAELFTIRPGEQVPQQATNFTQLYGMVRINGHAPSGIAWSPDSARVAIWVTPLNGPDPINDAGDAVVHVIDIATGNLNVYCGFSTGDHTPNPPRLVWSPDGAYLAFSENIPDDDKPNLLIVLNIETGVFTELSSGVFPALGRPDVIAWGLLRP